MKNKFAETLNELILKDSRTAGEIAAAAGIGASYLSQLRKGGKARPTLEVITKLAAALNVSPGKFTESEEANSGEFTGGENFSIDLVKLLETEDASKAGKEGGSSSFADMIALDHEKLLAAVGKVHTRVLLGALWTASGHVLEYRWPFDSQSTGKLRVILDELEKRAPPAQAYTAPLTLSKP